MNNLILFTFCLVSIFGISTSIEISCAYSVLHYHVLRNIYSCVIRRVSSPENPLVQVSGFHMNAKNNDDVQGLKGDIGNVLKFPKDIKNTFKNLIAIHFTNGQIKELSSDDLKSFPDLVELYFDNNKIEVVEEGTFDSNPKLAGISFMNNRVMHISANVFDHLTELKYLWLNGNPTCPNGVAGNNRDAVLSIIATAKSTCQSQAFLSMEKKLKDLSKSESNLEIDNLKAQMNNHEKNLAAFKAAIMKNFDDLETDYKNLHSELMSKFEKK